MQLTRDSIISAAVEILDTYGLGDMTMRRLAKHLGVVPGALYWHIPNKQSLIEAIAEEILVPVWGTEGVVKRSATQLCTDLRAAMMAHRDGAEVLSAALPVGDLTARLTEALVDALPPTSSDREVIAFTLLNYTIGATLYEQSASQLRQALDPQVPHPNTTTSHFRAGLNLILRGVLANS